MQLKNDRDTFVFFCHHQRASSVACNNDNHVAGDVEYFQRLIKQMRNELATGRVVKVNASSCLGKCRFGPNLVIFPDNVWYNYNTEEDLKNIVQKHIVDGQVVPHLLSKIHNNCINL